MSRNNLPSSCNTYGKDKLQIIGRKKSVQAQEAQAEQAAQMQTGKSTYRERVLYRKEYGLIG